MEERYKKLIIEMLVFFDESDELFLKRIYTLVKIHLEKRRKH